MIRSIIVSALATAALAAAGPVLAKPGKGGGHGQSASAKAGKAQGKAQSKGRGQGDEGTTARAKGRANSQGPAHASPRALERANENSVLAGNTVVAGPLSGLTVGTPVRMGDGVIGTVERIVPGSGRKVSNVLVRTSDGRIVPLSPDSLMSDGSGWSTSSMKRSGKGR